jgi:putative transcriptional regulator
MPISYKKLFHLLIDRDIKEGDFRKLSGISAPTLGKLKAGDTITTEMICKICAALDVQPGDIMEYVPDQDEPKAE